MMQPQEDRFAAALAHQLKSPSSALKAASENLRRNLRSLLEELGAMSEAASLGSTVDFMSRAVAEPAPPPMTGLLPKDRLEVILRRLADARIEGDLSATAACLLRGGWDTYLEEILPLLRENPLHVVDALEATARLRSNLRTIEVSLGRVCGIAATLRLLGKPVEGAQFDLVSRLEASAVLVREALPEEATLEVIAETVPSVAGHAELFDEVWTNLLTNAAQAIEAGGRIRLEVVAEEPSFVLVRIVDDGPGIPDGEAVRVFEPFFTTRAGEGGTGLGLSLCKQIVEAAGGSINFRSVHGETRFEVRLPVAVLQEA